MPVRILAILRNLFLGLLALLELVGAIPGLQGFRELCLPDYFQVAVWLPISTSKSSLKSSRFRGLLRYLSCIASSRLKISICERYA